MTTRPFHQPTMQSASNPPFSTQIAQMRFWHPSAIPSTGPSCNETQSFGFDVAWLSCDSQGRTTNTLPTAARAALVQTGLKNEKLFQCRATRVWSISPNHDTSSLVRGFPERPICHPSHLLTAKEITASLMTLEEKEKPNDLEPRLAEIALLPDSLPVRPHAISRTVRGVCPRTNTGITPLTDRDRETTTHTLLVGIDHRRMTRFDKIAWRLHITIMEHIVKILPIITARIRQTSGGPVQRMIDLINAISPRLCRYHPLKMARASGISVESGSGSEIAVVTVTATVAATVLGQQNEVGTAGAATEAERKGQALGPHLTPNPARSLVLDRRRPRRPPWKMLIATRTGPTCRISSTSFWAWNGLRRRSRPRARLYPRKGSSSMKLSGTLISFLRLILTLRAAWLTFCRSRRW